MGAQISDLVYVSACSDCVYQSVYTGMQSLYLPRILYIPKTNFLATPLIP